MEINVKARGYVFTKENMAVNPGRREFLASIAAVSELILHNANIVTVGPREPREQAVAVSRGRILAVGSDADVLQEAGKAADLVVLGGAEEPSTLISIPVDV